MNDRTIGRAGFLGILGVGTVGLFLAKDATGLFDRAIPRSLSAIVPTSGWRIYTVGSSMPTYDPATYRLDITGLVESPVSYTLADLKAIDKRIDEAVFTALSVEASVASRSSHGGTAPDQVRRRVAEARAALGME